MNVVVLYALKNFVGKILIIFVIKFFVVVDYYLVFVVVLLIIKEEMLEKDQEDLDLDFEKDNIGKTSIKPNENIFGIRIIILE